MYSNDPADPNDTVTDGAGPDLADIVLIDEPAPGVRRITMNRPDKRNALFHPLRGAILESKSSPGCRKKRSTRV